MSDHDNDLASEVSRFLHAKDSSWADRPHYDQFDRKSVLGRMDNIYSALTSVAGQDDYLKADQAWQQTHAFIRNSFDTYEQKTPSQQFDWVFAVPARTHRQQDDSYASEITPFLPLLDPKYGVDSNIRQRAVVGLPPTVIEQYPGNIDQGGGALLYTPLYEDMRSDYDTMRELMQATQHTIELSSAFARHTLKARVMGLGAILPSLTRFGKDIQQEGLTTTTGHGGTVYLIAETLRAVTEQSGNEVKNVGILGAAGSIGRSSVEILLQQSDLQMTLYDKNKDKMAKLAGTDEWRHRTAIALDEISTLASSDVIIAAITGQVQLDQIDPDHLLDLSGKTIIDDSQPGCFSREEVEARGGTLVWVVGQDASEKQILRRVSGYNFGDVAGLYGVGAVWGCEAETAAIALENRLDLSINSLVTSEQAVAIGALCRAIGVTVARPLQSFGTPISLDEGDRIKLPSVA